MSGSENAEKVTVSAGQTAQVTISGISGGVCRVVGTALFDFNRSFILPDNKPAIEQAFSMGMTRDSSGGAPTQKDNQFLLIVGHTDKVGSPQSNKLLSRRRALATWAVFIIDAESWENDLYQVEGWGDKELEIMSSEVDPNGGSNSIIEHYKNDKSARLDLMQRYLEFLRPDWLPQQSPPLRPNIVTSPTPPILGCGFEHLRNTPQESRRVEFFYFKTADPGVKDCSAYRSWQITCGELITVKIELQNEYGEPLESQFEIILPSGPTINEKTDSKGTWSRDNQPSGLYTINVKSFQLTELPKGKISKSSFEKTLSPASNRIRVQVIDIDKWFIPRQNPEIPDPSISSQGYTLGNQVDPLIDGQAAFRAMHDAFNATGKGGYIYITAWDMVPDIHLLERSLGPASQLQNVLGSAKSRGVENRILLWFVNAIDRPINRHRGGLGRDKWESFTWARIFTDNKTRGLTGSHHQKTAAVRTQKELISFIGGFDLTADKWDTSAHTFPNPDADYEISGGQPWHDVHARVRGPAAADIETNFRQRWNDGILMPGFPARTPSVPSHPAPKSLPSGSHIVQTLRTFPHHATRLKSKLPYDFARSGEFGLRLAIHRAIDNARDYIYIEDQYLISDREISPAIAAAMRRSSKLQVILVTAPKPDTGTSEIKSAFAFHQDAFVNNLIKEDKNRVQIFHLANSNKTEIYCHAKVCIIDDIWAIIGSCNISQRSLTNDSEISIAVIDGALENGRRKFAVDLRKALWAEHLGLTSAEIPLIEDPIAGAAEWRERAGKQPARAVVHNRLDGLDIPFWDTLIDPDGSTP